MKTWNLKNVFQKAYLKIVVVIFILVVTGLSTVGSYGATWDEWIEIHMVQWVHEFIHQGKPIERDSKYYGFIFNYGADKIANLSLSIGKLSNSETVNQFSDEKQKSLAQLKHKIQVKHIVTFLLSLVAYVSVAGIVGILAGWDYSWFGAIILALFPRFWGHSFFNPKDIPFAAMFSLGIFLGACLLDYYNKSQQSGLVKVGGNKLTFYSLLYGILVGLVTGVRIGGFFLLFFLIAAHLLSNIDIKNIWLRSRIFLPFYALIFIFWGLTTTLVYPAAWSNPVKWFIEALAHFSKYSVWDNHVLFNGEYIPGKSLPWYYLPQFIFMTVPLIFQISFILGLVWIIIKYKSLNESQRACIILVLLQVFWVPLIAILRQSTMYDEIRHFLFIMPGIAAIVATTFIWIYQKISRKNIKIFAITLLLVILSPIVFDMVSLHPYQYAYFNRAYGGLTRAYKQQETDYWGLSMREAMEWLNQSAPANSQIVLAGPSFAADIFADPKKNFQTINVDEFEEGKQPDPDYYLALPRYKYQEGFPQCSIVYQVMRQNTPLTIVKQCK